MEVCDISLFHRAMQLLVREKDINIIRTWIRLINKHICLFNKNIVNNVDHGQKIKIQTALCHLKRYKIQLKSSINYKRAGISRKRSDRVKWQDVCSSFKCRIRTGVVINLKHILFTEFLQDAFHLLKRRVQIALKKMILLKLILFFVDNLLKKEVMKN